MSVNQATQLLKTRTASQLCEEYGFNYFTFMKWFRRMAGNIKDINRRKLKKGTHCKEEGAPWAYLLTLPMPATVRWYN